MDPKGLLLPSTPRDGRSLAQLLHEALLEHDRQVSEMRLELARMQGLALSPAVVLGGPMLSPDVCAQRPSPRRQLPPPPDTPMPPPPVTPTEKKDVEVQTQAALSPEGSAAQQRAGPPPEAAPASLPKEQEQPESEAVSHWDEAPPEGQDSVDVEEFAQDMRWAASDGQSVQRSSTSFWESHRHHIWNQIEQVSTALILVNTLFLILQLQFTGYLAGSFLGVHGPGPFYDDSVKRVFDQVEVGFTIVFTIEFAVRLAKNGRSTFYYHHGHWDHVSVLDAVVVSVSVFDSLATYLLHVRTINMSFCRPLRFVRLLRLRSVRYGERFAKLRLLMETIVRSTMSLFWSMVFLWAVMLFGAIFICQCTAETYYDETIEESVRLWIYDHYGTVARSSYTIFEVTFSGGWPNYATPLVKNVSSLWAVFFVVYVTFIIFAVFRIISALFIKETMAVAAEDESTAVREAERKRAQFGAKLAALFREADESGDGQLTFQELEVCVHDTRFETILAAMGFTAKECVELFEVIDAGQDGCVSAHEFVSGMLRVKDGVRAQDIMRIVVACNLMVKDMHRRHEELIGLLRLQDHQ